MDVGTNNEQGARVVEQFLHTKSVWKQLGNMACQIVCLAAPMACQISLAVHQTRVSTRQTSLEGDGQHDMSN